MNVAAAAAAGGGRVLLLDADPLSTITDSLNLAQHPRRQSLRKADFDLPGVLVSDFVPGLDIFSPYEDGRCSDDELDELLRLITSPACEEGYGYLIVDTPPFLGANPAQLLSVCDEFVVVMQAEAMAYRTLPAFLELVQRSRAEGQKVQMRGILLTLPDSELPGGRWERELRGRFGNRILSQVIPHDEAVGKALRDHQIVSAVAPEAPAARAYHGLVASLGLATDRRQTGERAESPLLAAAAMFTPAVVGARGSSFGLDLPEAPPEFQPAEEPAWGAEPPEGPVTPSGKVEESERQTVVEHDGSLPPPRSLPGRTSGQFARPSVGSGKAPLPAVPPSTRLKTDAGSVARARVPKQPQGESSFSWAFVWVGLAVVGGVGLRFVHLPDFMLPIIVGVAVTAAVVLALRLMMAGAGAGENKTSARAAVPKRRANSSCVKKEANERTSPETNHSSRPRPPVGGANGAS
jgi:cellulose biosynthesis protein BcsQ